MSTDDLETQKRFKAKVAPNVMFIADPEAKLVKLFDVKMPVLTLAQRTTFVIGKDRKILRIDTGSDAIDPAGAVGACELP